MRRWCDVADVANLSSCCVIIQLKQGEKKLLIITMSLLL